MKQIVLAKFVLVYMPILVFLSLIKDVWFFAQPRGEYPDQWVDPYYGGQYYNGYGYMMQPPLDPRMYAAAPYGGYPVYGGQQQQ